MMRKAWIIDGRDGDSLRVTESPDIDTIIITAMDNAGHECIIFLTEDGWRQLVGWEVKPTFQHKKDTEEDAEEI